MFIEALEILCGSRSVWNDSTFSYSLICLWIVLSLLPVGPFCVNGFPLRRVCQSYVIATSTRLDISTLNIPEGVSDTYFTRSSSQKDKGGDLFADSKKVSYDIVGSMRDILSLLCPKYKASFVMYFLSIAFMFLIPKAQFWGGGV